MYPKRVLKYCESDQITLNGQCIAGSQTGKNANISIEVSVHALLIDPLTSSIKTRNPDLNDPAVLSEISGFNIGDTVEINFLTEKPNQARIYEGYISAQSFSIKRTGKKSISIKVTGPDEKEEAYDIENVDVIHMHNGEIFVREIVKASRHVVHARYDKFSPQNHDNISRAFEEVIKLVGENNRSEIEDGWSDTERVPK
jgi:hypothetical protein